MTSKGSQIAIYARVSTEEQARQQEGSLDSQIYRCRQYLRAHHSEDVVEGARVYREEGESGKDLNRPAFQEMMRDIRRGVIQQIVFTELSRISRNVHDFLGLSGELDCYGVQFTSLREKFDTTSPHGRLIITVLMALNQFEREQVAERTRLNMRARAERGLFSGGTIPLGYHTDLERSGHLLVEEDEARIVRAAFDAYLKTGSMRKTAQQLKQRGLKRPVRIQGEGKLRRATYLTREHLRHMLKNPSYAGLKEINRVNRVLSEEEMQGLPECDRYHVVEAVWEPIIKREIWLQIQTMIEESDRTRTNVTKRYKHHFTMSGLLYCVGCGTLLHGASAKRQTYFYYQHPAGAFSEGCPRRRWTADVVEKSVLSRLGRLAEDEALLELVVTQANERLASGLPSLERELSAARDALSRHQAENRALVSRLVGMPQDAVPQSFWDIAREKEAEIQATREELLRLERKKEDLEAAKLTAADFKGSLQNLVQVYEQLQPIEQSRLLACLIDRIVLDDEKATMWLMGEQPELVNPSAESSPRGATSSPCWT